MYFTLSLAVTTALLLKGPPVSAHQEPPLDMTKNLILPNFRMFSDIAHIFYHPDTGHPIPMKYSKEIPGTDLLTKGFGLIPCECHRDQLYCSCCVFVSIQRFNFQRTACSNLTVQTDNLELDLTIDYSGYTLANRSLSLRHPPPFCIPTPQIPALLSCVRVHDITVKRGIIEFCINFEIKVVAIPNPVFILEFTCVNYGPDGLILERPATYHHIHGNSSEPQGSVNWNVIHEHLMTSSTTERVLEIEVSTPGTTQPPNTPETQSPDSQQPTTTTEPPVETQPDKTPSKPPSKPIKPTIEPNSSLVDNRAPSEETNHKGSDPKEPKKGTHQKLEKPTEGLLQAQNEQNIDIPNQTVEPERVEIVSLDVADFEDPSQKRSGGYLTYNRWRY